MGKRVVIAGGGVGGLAAAIRLQSMGFGVVLLEKNHVLGGKLASRITSGGYVDLGPTLLTMIPVFEDLFAAVDENIHHHLDLHPIDPSCRYRWSDGTEFNTWSERSALLAETEQVFPDDVAALQRFLEDVERLYEATRAIFLERPFRGLRELFTLENLKLGPLIGSLGFTSTMARTLERRFRNPKLIQLLGRFATYNGSSPYKAPATLNLIAHVELSMGAFYPSGGMTALAGALEKVARSTGVEIHTGCAVESVRLDAAGRTVTSVEAEGEGWGCDYFISNVDALWTWRHLLEPAGSKMPARLERAERSCSGFLVTGTIPRPTAAQKEAHHQIYFSDHYREEFRDIFERGIPSGEMTIYRSIPSVTDPSLAESSGRGCYLLVNVPQGEKMERPEEYLDRILTRLQSFGVSDPMSDVEIMTPSIIEERYGSVGGAIYGNSSNSIFSAFLRPTNAIPGVSNAYMVGGSVHPGGGLPLVALSGKIVAEEIAAEAG